MRLALLISRQSQFPILESTARSARARGHSVTVILDHGLAGGPKAAQVPALPVRWTAWTTSTVEVADPRAGLPSLLTTLGADALLEVYAPSFDPGGLRRAGWRGVLGHVQGVISDVTDLDPAPYDRVYTWAPSWARLWAEWPEQKRPRSLAETVPFRAVGFPQADLLADPPSDPWARFRIPADQPCVVYLPFPATTLRWHWWSHGVYAKPWPFVATERRVLAALRAYCARTGAWLIVKGLHRRGVAPWIAGMAHRVVWDEPGEATMLRLLQSTDARLLVHHLSTSVSEAAVCGVPSVCIAPPRPGWLPQYAPRMRHLDFAAPARADAEGYWHDSFYDFNNAAHAVPPRAAIGIFDTWELRRKEDCPNFKWYRERYFGEPPYQAGERIIEDLEGRTR